MPPAYLKGADPGRQYAWRFFCSGKQAFESAVLANEVAVRRARRGIVNTAYRCAECGSWHLGTPPKYGLQRFHGPENRNLVRKEGL